MYKKIDGYHHHENPTKAMRALGNGYHVHAAADGRRHLRLRWPRRSLVMLVIQRIRLGGTRWQFLLRNTWHPKKPRIEQGICSCKMDQTCLEYSCSHVV